MEMETETERKARKWAPRLIERATQSTAQEVDPRLLKAIKSTLRSSDDEVRLAVETLMDKMKKRNSQIRYLALLIVDELFMRSKLFRSLLIINFDQFLSLSIGFRKNLPLPPPSSIASILRSKSIELLEKWNASFGIHYRQLRLGFDYLKNTLSYQFPNRIETAARLQQERREREIRSKQILVNKFETLKRNYSSIKAEIRSTIDEIEECLDIVHTKEDDFFSNISAKDDEVEEFRSLTLQQIRQEALKEGEKVHENIDNKAIFDALRELYKLLVSKHLASVQEWISVLVRVDLTDNKFRDTVLKEFIDIRNLIQSVKKRCDQLDCALNDASLQEDEDLWEECKIEPYVPENSSAVNSSVKDSVATLTTKKGKNIAPPVDSKTLNGEGEATTKKVKDTAPPVDIKSLNGEGVGTSKKGKDIASPDNDISSTEDGSSSTSQRSRLMAEAPVVPWSSFLDTWNSSRDVLANQRGLEVEGHWGRVDYDAVIPAEKIAELNYHRTVYTEQPVEIQPCLAPLKNGGFCQRKDLKVCPFHGPIIPRDTEGNPIGNNPSREGESEKKSSTQPIDPKNDSVDVERSLDLDRTMVEQLARQAVKNVRERDQDLRALKRAKHARIRQHNDEVLREAALVSTSYSEAVVESAAATYHNGLNLMAKEPTVASLLRKKVTAKDRLAQRLLNTRVTDASSRQLMQGEDSSYREAFPNQW